MKDSRTFDPIVFSRLRKAEENYFWFDVRRRWIYDRITKFVPPPGRLLEIGCGTGNVSSHLASKGYEVTGCEYFDEAISMSWPGYSKVRADALALPFENRSYGIIGLFDVVEHFQDDAALLKEAARVLNDGGIIALTVPAGEELWSSVDERALHKRRYTRKSLEQVISKTGLRPLLIEYMFMSLYLPMRYLRQRGKAGGDEFDIRPFINGMFKCVFNLERFASRFVSLPIGTSLIAIAGKAGEIRE